MPIISVNQNNSKKWLPCFFILLLVALTLFTYHLFLCGINIGGKDAQWYQYMIHDAILQVQHGIFPIYVEQSEFNFIGMPVIRAPYYYLLGLLLHFLTFGKLNALYIQHLTVLVSALGGALMMYFLLLKTTPRAYGFAFLFAFFYISCPGVMGLIYKLDMYNSFMTLPYIPIVIYGLIRSHTKNDYLSYIIVAIGLAFIMMAHPPIALWLLLICTLFYGLQIIFFGKGWKTFYITIPFFIALSLWQTTSVAVLHLGEVGQGTHDYAREVINTLRDTFPGSLLPLGWTNVYLQLGYALWGLLIFGMIIAIKYKNALLQCFLVCVLFLILYLYPFPYLSHFLWSSLPTPVKHITVMHPEQRFYFILAGLACFIGIMSLHTFYIKASQKKRYLILLICFLFFCWNIIEARYFFYRPLRNVNHSWVIPNNFYFFPDYVMPQHDSVDWEFTYDPYLKVNLLDSSQHKIPSVNNETFVLNKCLQKSKPFFFTIKPGDDHPNLLTLTHLSSEQPYLLCLTFLKEENVNLPLLIHGENTLIKFHQFPTATQNMEKTTIGIPIFVHQNAENLSVTFDTFFNHGFFQFLSYGLTPYHLNQLPIDIKAFTPFKATFSTPANHTYLALFKEYYPGYVAFVNGKKVDVIPSKSQIALENNMLLIPIPHKGFNQVELIYEGLPLMRVTFYISLMAWILVITTFLRVSLRAVYNSTTPVIKH